MADSLDLLSAGLNPAEPVAGADLLADPHAPGPFKRGFGAGVAGVKSSIAGAGALAAHAVGATGLEQAALAKADEQSQVAAGMSQSAENIDWTSPASVLGHFSYLVGNAVPSLLTMAAGAAVGRGLGAVAGRTAAATRAGTFAGAVAPDVALEAGGIYPEAVNNGTENPALRAAAGGAAAASLDFIPLLEAEKFLKPVGKGGFGALVKGAAKGAPVGAALEGTQELGQSVIERAAAGSSLTDHDAIKDYVDSFLGGAAPGSLFGAAIGSHRQSAAPVAAAPAATALPQAVAAPAAAAPVLSPAEQDALDHSTLSAQHATTTQALAELEQQHATATAEHATITARLAELKAEEKQPLGERRTRSDILVERKALTARAKELTAGMEKLGGDMFAARTTIGNLTGQIDNLNKRLNPAAPLPTIYSDEQLAFDSEQNAGGAPLHPTIGPEAGPGPVTKVPKAAPLASDLLADPNAPVAVASDPAALAAQAEAEKQKGIVATERAVRAVHQTHGMLSGLAPKFYAADEDNVSRPAVPVDTVTERTPRSRSTAEGTMSRAQRTAVLDHAMTVIEPLAQSFAEAKTREPGGQVKRAKAMTAAMRGVVEEASRLPTVEAAQEHIRTAMPAALKGHGVAVDAEDIGKVVASVTDQARTLYSKGASVHPGRWSENAAALVPRGQVTWTDSTGGLGASSGQINGKPVAHLRKVNGGYVARVEGWQWEVSPDSGTARFNEIPGQKITHTPSKLFKTRDQAKRAVEQLLAPAVQESHAALTQEQFEALPQAGQERVVDTYNAIMAEKGRALTAHLRQLIGDDPNLTVNTFSATPGSPIGSYTRTDNLKSLITLALNAKNGLSVADHEGFHYAEDQLLNASERAVIRAALTPGKPMYEKLLARVQQYDRENHTHLADEIAYLPAEAHAYAFEFWRRGELQTEGHLQRLFEKVMAVLRSITRFVTGQGYGSMEDIFNALDRGQFAERQRNAGQLSDGAGVYQSKDPTAAWYRSALTAAFEAMPERSMTAAQWKALIWEPGSTRKVAIRDENNRPTGETREVVTPTRVKLQDVKQDEIDAVGLEEFLDLKQGKITRDEVLSFLRENGVRVEETTLGGPRATAHDKVQIAAYLKNVAQVPMTEATISEIVVRASEGDADAISELEQAATGDEYARLLAPFHDQPAAKFSAYQLPGATNYRELLLTLPGKALPTELPVGYEVGQNRTHSGVEWRVEGPNAPVSAYGPTRARAIENFYRASPAGGENIRGPEFRSSHFDTPNILAHIRFNERTDAEGKRVLFIEELQSDWAKEGRTQGFVSPKKKLKDISAAELGAILDGLTPPTSVERSENYTADYHRAAEHIHELITANRTGDLEGYEVGSPQSIVSDVLVMDYNWTERAAGELQQALDQYGAIRAGVPTAPFVTKTDAWTALTLKRMIRYAAENGFDKIAWTTGDQQVTRYKDALQKQVDRIEWTKTDKGVQIVGYKGASNVSARDEATRRSILASHKVVDTTEKESELSDAIGKAMADRIKNDPAQSGVIEGDDITISDTGMAGYYDKIVPAIANDVLKKLGGGKVGEVVLRRGLDADLIMRVQNEWTVAGESQRFPSREAAQRSLESHQPGLTLSPENVQRALAGVNLFSRGAVASPDGLEILNRLTPQQRGLYSQAAVAAEQALARESAEGGQVQNQTFVAAAKLMEDAMAHGSEHQTKVLLGALSTEVSGGVSQWLQKNILTPNYTSRLSAGYRNVFKTLNTYIRYRNDLVERMLIQKIPQWYTAPAADQNTAFDALLKRTLERYTPDSQEFRTLVGGLTEQQRAMFHSATDMIAGMLDKEFEVDRAFHKQVLVSAGEYEKWLAHRTDQIRDLKEHGYVPLRRYGDHTVHVYMEGVDADGRTQKLSGALQFFQNAAAAHAVSKIYEEEIARTGARWQVEVGTHYKAARDTTVSAQQFLDTARRNGVPLTALEKERLVKALTSADSLTRNRMLHREGMPGYSKDGMRVLNEFGMNTAGKIAYAEFASAIDAAGEGRTVESDVVNGQAQINVDMPAEGETAAQYKARSLWAQEGPMSGFHHNLADELVDYVLVPDHTGGWSRKLRGAAMMYFIGGSISSGLVNVMSVPMMVVPQLAVHTDYGTAAATTLGAWKTTWKYQHILRDIERLKDSAANLIPEVDSVPGLRGALIEAQQYTMDTELHQIMGISQGALLAQNQTVQRAVKAWMAPFRVSEQTNRITSFIAGYKVGMKNGLSGPALFQFARETIDATQNNYNESNRPGAARNPITALLFMFKSFPLFMTESIALMYRANPKAAIYALLGLTAMTGVQGLPFAESIEDLIDTIAQQVFGSPFNTRRAMRNVLKSASEAFTGYDASELVLRGAINSVTGMSVSSRIGAGDFVPGSRLGTADADQGKVLEQFLGAPYAMIKEAASASGAATAALVHGDWKGAGDALRAGGPVAVRNAIKGAEQLRDGFATDSKDRKLVDVTGLEAMLQMAGVSSAGLAKAYEMEKINTQTKAFYTQVSAEMQQKLVQAVKDNDTEAVQEITDLRNAWNAAYPTMPIMPSPSAVRRDMMLSGQPLDRRSMMLWARRIRGANVFAEDAQQN